MIIINAVLRWQALLMQHRAAPCDLPWSDIAYDFFTIAGVATSLLHIVDHGHPVDNQPVILNIS